MRIVVLLAALVLVAGCGEDDGTAETGQSAATELRVTVNDGTERTAVIRCNAPSDSDVCGALADIEPKTFEPVPGNVACTQQYGGPETARVTGSLDGKDVDAKFSRENGCEIERWEAAKPLFEAAG